MRTSNLVVDIRAPFSCRMAPGGEITIVLESHALGMVDFHQSKDFQQMLKVGKRITPSSLRLNQRPHAQTGEQHQPPD